MFAPVGFGLLVAVVAVLVKAVRGARVASSTIATMAQALLLVAPLAYLPLARATLTFFDCTKLAGLERFFLDANLSVECYGPEWQRLLYAAIFGLVVYVLGIPLVLGGSLIRARGRLFNDAQTVRALGALYKSFRQPMYLWALFGLARKLLVVVCSLFLSRAQSLQISALLLVILGAAMVQASVRPHFWPFYDRLDFGSSGFLAIQLGCGMASFAERAQSGAVGAVSTVASTTSVIAAISWTALVLLVVWCGIHIVIEVVSIAREHRQFKTVNH